MGHCGATESAVTMHSRQNVCEHVRVVNGCTKGVLQRIHESRQLESVLRCMVSDQSPADATKLIPTLARTTYDEERLTRLIFGEVTYVYTLIARG